ncbi:hypothetical protein [Vibrio splendidus]|uniref:hypothetical protein n=1 Tax=Vibrio splendidus TaxID=29497 RepID=UPI0039A6F802
MPFDIKSSPQDWVDNIRMVHGQNGGAPFFLPARYSPSVGMPVLDDFVLPLKQRCMRLACLPDDEEAAGI